MTEPTMTELAEQIEAREPYYPHSSDEAKLIRDCRAILHVVSERLQGKDLCTHVPMKK